MIERPIIYVQIADNGNLRKWAFVPFEGGIGYRAMDRQPDGGGLDDGPPLPLSQITDWRDRFMREEFISGASHEALAERYCMSRSNVIRIVGTKRDTDPLRAATARAEAAEARVKRLDELLREVPGCLNDTFAAGIEEGRDGGSARRQEKLMHRSELLRREIREELAEARLRALITEGEKR